MWGVAGSSVPSDPAEFSSVRVPFQERLGLRRLGEKAAFRNFLPELGGREFLVAAIVGVYL